MVGIWAFSACLGSELVPTKTRRRWYMLTRTGPTTSTLCVAMLVPSMCRVFQRECALQTSRRTPGFDLLDIPQTRLCHVLWEVLRSSQGRWRSGCAFYALHETCTLVWQQCRLLLKQCCGVTAPIPVRQQRVYKTTCTEKLTKTKRCDEREICGRDFGIAVEAIIYRGIKRSDNKPHDTHVV